MHLTIQTFEFMHSLQICTEMQFLWKLHCTDLVLQRRREVCQTRRAVRGRLPEWKQSVAEKEPGTPATIAYFMQPNSKHWKRVLGIGVPVALEATTSILHCTVSWHEQAQKSSFTKGNMHRGRVGARSWFKEGESSGSAEGGRRGGVSGRCLLSLQERGGAEPLQRGRSFFGLNDDSSLTSLT